MQKYMTDWYGYIVSEWNRCEFKIGGSHTEMHTGAHTLIT